MDMKKYWQSQWASFCPHFKDGFAHIHLAHYGGPNLSFKMSPGGGFGDLSHPTTKLCLTYLCNMKIDHPTPFIDVGCGSGVLSLAASVLGLSPILSIDIDPAAILHSKQNSELNNACLQVSHHLPSTLPQEKPVVFMNMISSEAELAWESVAVLHDTSKTLVTSGILTEHREDYLSSRPASYGVLSYKTSLDGWSLFVFES